MSTTIKTGKEKQLKTSKSNLICQICNKYLKAPVQLPCGPNICKEHIAINEPTSSIKEDPLSSSSSSNHQIKVHEYSCQLCKNRHKMMASSFAVNNWMSDLLGKMEHLDESELIRKRAQYNQRV